MLSVLPMIRKKCRINIHFKGKTYETLFNNLNPYLAIRKPQLEWVRGFPF